MGKATLFCTFVLLIWQGRAREGHKRSFCAFSWDGEDRTEKQVPENETVRVHLCAASPLNYLLFPLSSVVLGAVPPATEAPAPQIPI